MSEPSVQFIASVPDLGTPPGYSYAASAPGELERGQVPCERIGNRLRFRRMERYSLTNFWAKFLIA